MKSVIAVADASIALATQAELENVHRLTKDIKEAVSSVGIDEARFLVDTYYQIQHERITAAARIRALSGEEEPHALMNWLFKQFETLENQIKLSLDKYTDCFEATRWAKSQVGIGPVISAGLYANIDPAQCNHAAKVWRYAGLAPHYDWGKGQKRPWNARLKTLCAFKMGESFVKTCNHPNSYYGRIYKQRKELETLRNEAGEFANIAKDILEKKTFNKSTEAYKAYSQGKLPLAHIHARARRVAVKLFISHFTQVLWESTYNTKQAPIYAIAHLDHDDYQSAPGWSGIK